MEEEDDDEGDTVPGYGQAHRGGKRGIDREYIGGGGGRGDGKCSKLRDNVGGFAREG